MAKNKNYNPTKYVSDSYVERAKIEPSGRILSLDVILKDCEGIMKRQEREEDSTYKEDTQ